MADVLRNRIKTKGDPHVDQAVRTLSQMLRYQVSGVEPGVRKRRVR